MMMLLLTIEELAFEKTISSSSSLALFRDNSDLGLQSSIDELCQVETSNSINKSKVQVTKVQSRQLKLVKDTSLGNSKHGGELLELEKRLEAEVSRGEEILEDDDVEVVSLAEDLELAKVELVDPKEVVEVNLAEGKAATVETIILATTASTVLSVLSVILTVAFTALLSTRLPQISTSVLTVAAGCTLVESSALFRESENTGSGGGKRSRGDNKEGGELHLERIEKMVFVLVVCC
jgi:hypothetical protein